MNKNQSYRTTPVWPNNLSQYAIYPLPKGMGIARVPAGSDQVCVCCGKPTHAEHPNCAHSGDYLVVMRDWGKFYGIPWNW